MFNTKANEPAQKVKDEEQYFNALSVELKGYFKIISSKNRT